MEAHRRSPVLTALGQSDPIMSRVSLGYRTAIQSDGASRSRTMAPAVLTFPWRTAMEVTMSGPHSGVRVVNQGCGVQQVIACSLAPSWTVGRKVEVASHRARRKRVRSQQMHQEYMSGAESGWEPE